MASITIDPATQCVKLVCGAGEVAVSFTAAALYRAWKDWFVTSDNSKYLPAFDSTGGDPVGTSSLDNVYLLRTDNGWLICPETVEPEVIVRINGNLFPVVVGAPLFGYSMVVAGGRTHVETTVSTSARVVTSSGDADALAATTAAAVRTNLAPELARIDVATSTRASATVAASIKANTALIPALV